MTAVATTQLVALDDEEIGAVIAALRDAPEDTAAGRLADRLQFGDGYKNALDALVRLRQHRDLINAEKRRVDQRLADLEETVLEDFADRGVSGERHAATGKLVSISRKLWARVDRAAADRPATPEEKQRAAAALKAAGLGDYVEETFNVNSLSAHFRELARAHDEEQRQLPEHQRTPLDVDELLPVQLRGAIELTDTPTLSVRS